MPNTTVLNGGKKFLVWDHGLFSEQANALSGNGKNQVKYYTPYAGTFPIYRDFAKGRGFGHLEKELYFWEWMDWSDSIVNFDVGNQDQIAWLRKKFPEKSIFGSGLGAKFEDNRWMLKEFQKALHLPENPSVLIQGITRLREYLKKNPDKFVKMNIFRQDMESFHAKDYESVELKLDQISGFLGPHKDEYEFIVENFIDTEVEIGFDGFFNGLDYLRPFLIGYEYKKNLYIGKVTDSLPGPLQETMEAFKPVLKRLDYRGALSTEERIISAQKHYLLDFCARLGSPFSVLYTQFVRNWPDLVFETGRRGNPKVEFTARYFGALALKTPEALDVYVKVNIPKEHRDKVKLLMVSGNEKGYYAVKGLEEVAIVIASGNTVDEVLNGLRKNGDYVEADGLQKESLNGIDRIKEIIKKGQTFGINF